MATVHQPLGEQPGRILTSTVLGVTLRVAGAVPTETHAYAIGTPEQQVTARLGDVLIYISDPGIADLIRPSLTGQFWPRTSCPAGCRRPGCTPSRVPIR